ncbi:putative ATPase [Brevibacterium pityocampae]
MSSWNLDMLPGSQPANHIIVRHALSEHLQIVRAATTNRSGFFLRAETMHENMAYLMNVGSMRGHHYAQRSHGEMFVEMLTDRFMELGLWILDR